MSALPAALGRVRPAVEHRLTQVLEDCHRRYLAVPDRLKKLLNQQKRLKKQNQQLKQNL
mgnify:CR=1 FL=1